MACQVNCLELKSCQEKKTYFLNDEKKIEMQESNK